MSGDGVMNMHLTNHFVRPSNEKFTGSIAIRCNALLGGLKGGILMKNEGWSWGDLAGELMAQGIDPDTVTASMLEPYLDCQSPEQAAEAIRNNLSA